MGNNIKQNDIVIALQNEQKKKMILLRNVWVRPLVRFWLHVILSARKCVCGWVKSVS